MKKFLACLLCLSVTPVFAGPGQAWFTGGSMYIKYSPTEIYECTQFGASYQYEETSDHFWDASFIFTAGYGPVASESRVWTGLWVMHRWNGSTWVWKDTGGLTFNQDGVAFGEKACPIMQPGQYKVEFQSIVYKENGWTKPVTETVMSLTFTVRN